MFSIGADLCTKDLKKIGPKQRCVENWDLPRNQHHQIRLTIGKGTMGDKAVSQMKQSGTCYLTSTGGCEGYTPKI
jgi:tartrate dehydratase beta subunit/fumarate hydratase class I family protein